MSSKEICGYCDLLFIDEPSEEFICALCLEILRNPKQCLNGHLFCEICISVAMKKQSSCPVCKCNLNLDCLATAIVIRNHINKLVVHCAVPDPKIEN